MKKLSIIPVAVLLLSSLFYTSCGNSAKDSEMKAPIQNNTDSTSKEATKDSNGKEEKEREEKDEKKKKKKEKLSKAETGSVETADNEITKTTVNDENTANLKKAEEED